MPLQLLSRPTTDAVRSRPPSLFATPASKPQIPAIFLTSATPCDADPTDDARQVAPWIASEASPVPIAPKLTTNGEASRKRLVPKKSKLGLLGSSSSAAKAREQDFSDVVRRVGGASVQDGNASFEIYVDPANDPDIGDILVVKKRKSRLALDGLEWGALGEVTNVPSVAKPKDKVGKKESLLKMKVDENQKWWSVGRGRKDSKEKCKVKDKDRAKSPQPTDKPTDTRGRFNSLDSGSLLKSLGYEQRPNSPAGQLDTSTPPAAAGSGSGKDSVAIRAMRSVRSLARIGSWAQLKNTPNPDATTGVVAPIKVKESDGKKKKKKKEKEKDKDKETIRYSGSSFEAGALTASPAASKHETKSLGKRKGSILGIGLPSTIRLPSARSGSTGSSINTTGPRLSVDSASLLGGGILARGRSGSTMSTTSSLRPMSTKSSGSRQSSGSSGAASVRWDEVGLQTAKEIRRKDKEIRRREKEKEKEESREKKSKESRSGKDSTRKSSDSRKRTPLSAIFPGIVSERGGEEGEQPPVAPITRAVAAEGYADGRRRHEVDTENSPMDTPVKRVRPRPVSEQLLDQSRPKPFYERNDDNAAMSLLDAATNDLAQLINRLDLEATPGSVETTPIGRRSPLLQDPSANSPPSNRLTTENPVKDLRRKKSSISSLGPYMQSRSKSISVQIGQNIAPWSTLNASISPSKTPPSTIKVNFQDNMATIRTHKRTRTPAPAADPSPVFKALRPATTRLSMSKTVVGASSGISPFVINPIDRSLSSMTFDSGHSKSESHGSLAASPVFKKAQTRKRSFLGLQAELGGGSLPILPEVRRSLGLAGTMGSSIGSIAGRDYDGSDPDSDIPDELQVILSNSDQEGEDTISFVRQPARPSLPSPGLPPEMPLPVIDSSPPESPLAEVPVFRATVIGEDEHHADVEEALSEDDTKRSFDFTGELQRLNESGVSDRRSFIEQLENAFRTPAKIDLRYDFEDPPPVPKLPSLQDELSRVGEDSFNLPIDYESRGASPRGFPVDDNPEPLLPISDNFAANASDEELLNIIAPQMQANTTSVASRPSNGELNRDFKFGGKHSSSSKKEPSPLTLSDIIPPPEIARSLFMASFAGDENSSMKSILAHAIQIGSPPGCSGTDFVSTSKREACETARNSLLVFGHQRNSSGLSFAGFDSFAEIRRGFEYSDTRPGFYPPPTISDRRRQKHESIQSIASVSSYGNVLYGGSADPFDYGSIAPLPSLRERPSSDDFSFTMSTAVDDTFSFMRRQSRRYRVDSDASSSSFYFRAPHLHPYSRSNRRPESGVSIGPPISLFNRNSTHHRRGDSGASISSIANSHGNCRRFSWTRPRSNFSVESPFSDFSEAHIGRPGLGDKMLESAQERVSPLPSISISPLNSARGERVHSNEYDSRTSYDSIIDSQYESQKTDSLFEKTGRPNSVSLPDSMFFEEHSGDAAAKPPRYRPISSLSIPSVHSPPKEDDTVISMLGGGHVRRRSVTSMIGASPCIQVERRKNILANPPETVFDRIKNKSIHLEDHESPEVARVIETKPSIASTANSFQFGDERIIRARHGLLEWQSLENTVLIGDGEDLSASFRVPVFTRPNRTNRSRSSTCTSRSGAETPPLSISDGYSSLSEGSLSSIDLSQLNTLLSNATHTTSNAALERARPPARGHSRRRRISQARASRTSIYETIEEELASSLSPTKSPGHLIPGFTSNVPKRAAATKTMDPPQVFVVDPETSSMDSFSLWDDEQGISALRRYYALRDEAEGAVTESKRTWADTPLSIFAMQSFDPPRQRSGMQAMLQHSLQNYGPLPSDLRPRRTRSRVNSRPSPYPRTVKTSFTPSPVTEHLRATVVASLTPPVDGIASRQPSPLSNALQQITINPNVPLSVVAAESKECPISPDKPERVFGLAPRSQVGTTVRRTALGWSKKSTRHNGVGNKENHTTIGNNIGVGGPTTVNVSQGTITTPADGLRLNRPRPRGRPVPAPVRPFRV